MLKKIYNFLFDHRINLFIVLIFFLAGLKLSQGIANVLDVHLADESTYLSWGKYFPSWGLRPAWNGALYSLWYYCLSLVEPDALNLYYVNAKLLTIFGPLLFYVFLRTIGIPVLPSIIVPFFYLISKANLPVIPKPSHFALMVALVFLIIASKLKSNLWSLAVICIGSLFVSFVRAEFFLSYIIFVGLFIVVIIKRSNADKESLKKSVFPAMLLLLVSLVSLSIFGLPFNQARAFMAFGQHFSLNWVKWTNSDMHSWLEWQEIISKNFGDSNTIMQAIKNNPWLFTRHVTANVKNCFSSFFDYFFVHYNFVLPVSRVGSFSTTYLRFLEGALLFVLAIIYVVFTSKKWVKNLAANFREHKRTIIHSLVFSLPALISIIIVYPRGHYLLFLAIPFFSVLLMFFAKNISEKGIMNNVNIFLIGILILYMTPTVLNTRSKTRNLNIIHSLASLNVEKKMNIFFVEPVRYFPYLRNSNYEVYLNSKGKNFFDFVKSNKINVVVVHSSNRVSKKNINEKKWLDFLVNHEVYGFSRMDIPETPSSYILVKNSLYYPINKF